VIGVFINKPGFLISYVIKIYLFFMPISPLSFLLAPGSNCWFESLFIVVVVVVVVGLQEVFR
jgi:hypothetical protein